jgi:hypothetical protein
MSEILGWRGWSLGGDTDGPLLCSPYRATPWPGPVLVADRKPRLCNSHGIYAVQDPNSGYLTCCDFIGEVALLGRVVVGETGYRAERAVVRSLYLGHLFDFLYRERAANIQASLGARYDVEVHAKRPVPPLPFGVLRLMGVDGQVVDSAPFFGGPVRFAPATADVTIVGTRLDLPIGNSPGLFPRAAIVFKGGVATITIHGWTP